MSSLDSVSITILLGAVLVMAGILSSLLALRFGAPLLLVFLLIGIVAGDSGPGRVQFRRPAHHLSGGIGGAGADPVRWRIEDALPEHQRGFWRRRCCWRRSRAADGADHRTGRQICARSELDRGRYWSVRWWPRPMCGAVFLLVHAQGLRLRPRVGATLEAESGTNDPFAVFLTLMLVELISVGDSSLSHVALEFGREAVLGTVTGVIGGRLVVLGLNRVALPQGLHAAVRPDRGPGDFGAAQIAHGSGFLAVYLAGIIIGNRPTRAHNSVVTFLDAATWLAQIVMFVLALASGLAASGSWSASSRR